MRVSSVSCCDEVPQHERLKHLLSPVLGATGRDPGVGRAGSEASVLGVQTAVSSLCPLTAAPLCVSVSPSPLLVGTPVVLDSVPSWSFHPDHLFTDPVPTHSTPLGPGS